MSCPAYLNKDQGVCVLGGVTSPFPIGKKRKKKKFAVRAHDNEPYLCDNYLY